MDVLFREFINQLFVATNIANKMFGAESEMAHNFILALETYSAISQYDIEFNLDLIENIIDTQEVVCYIFAEKYGEVHDKTRESIWLYNTLVDKYNALL